MRIRDLSAWEAFYWVAKETSFTRAAKRLKVTLPLLSKRISNLEAELGVRLFHRTTRKVSMTQDGKVALPRIQTFLEDAQSLEDIFGKTDEVSGTIRISCVTAFAHRVLAPLLTEFNKAHPRVRFEIEVTDTELDLLDHQLDLAIRVQEPVGADFVFKKLLTNRLVLCASPGYLKSQTARVRKPEDLGPHSILMLQVYENCRFSKSEIKLGSLSKSKVIQSESGLFLTELALNGAGIAVRSFWDVESLLKSGKLVEVLGDYPLEPFGKMYAVIPSRRLLANRVRAFVDFIERYAKGSKWT